MIYLGLLKYGMSNTTLGQRIEFLGERGNIRPSIKKGQLYLYEMSVKVFGSREEVNKEYGDLVECISRHNDILDRYIEDGDRIGVFDLCPELKGTISDKKIEVPDLEVLESDKTKAEFIEAFDRT